MGFKKATKKDAILRLALIGPAGSGKTRTALEIASRLGKRIAVIDSEGGRSRAYSDLFDFDVDDELPDYSPETYVARIKAAQTDGYDVIIVDSASHEWAGKGGTLAKVDKVGSQSNNKWAAWAVGTPAHQAFIDAVTQCKRHIILTLRAKTEWVIEPDERGKQKPKAVGLGAVAREGTEYEVDFACLLDMEHRLTVTKTTNFAELEGQVFTNPGEDFANAMKRWLATSTTGHVPAVQATPAALPAPIPPTPEAAPAAPPPPNATPVSGDVVAPAAKAEPLAKTFTDQIRNAPSLHALQSIASVISAAFADGKINAAERSGLLAVYELRGKALAGPAVGHMAPGAGKAA